MGRGRVGHARGAHERWAAPSCTNGSAHAWGLCRCKTTSALGKLVFAGPGCMRSPFFFRLPQVWHMDAYVNLPSGSRPEYHTLTGHTSSVYALVVHERQLISASHDKLVKATLCRCIATSAYHARTPPLAFAGMGSQYPPLPAYTQGPQFSCARPRHLWKASFLRLQ